MTDPRTARNDTAPDSAEEDGQIANPGPVPPAPEDIADSGEGSSSSRLDGDGDQHAG